MRPTRLLLALLVSMDEAVSIDATRAFLRACFSTQPTASEFENMLGFNTMAPGDVRRAMSGRPAPYEPALRAVWGRSRAER